VKTPTTLEEALAIIQLQSEYITKLEARIAEQDKRIAQLESQLSKNSKNSSKPPSSDWKGNTQKGKNRGGAKPGHQGFARAPISEEKITRQIVVMPKACPRCGGTELGSERKPIFHHVIDLPEIVPDITRYRLERCRCLACGKHVRAELPQGVPHSMLGPRLTAFIGLLNTTFSASLRKSKKMIGFLIKEEFSPATIFASQQRISNALAGTYEQIQRAFTQEKVVGADETGWRTRGQRRWVWVGSGTACTVLQITAHRSRACAEQLLGKSSHQPLITDRYQAYAPKGPHQYCLAHWKRDIESLTKHKEACEELSFDLREVFINWKLYEKKLIDRKQLRSRIGYRRDRMRETLNYWAIAGPEDLQNFCERHLKHFDRYWTFLRIDGMEPTNNRSERDLRQLVIRRKICFGTRSEEGERFVERIYSTAQTLAKRGGSLFSYLEQSIRAYWAGEPSPTLPATCV